MKQTTTMKISKKTLEVLKNFSNINQNLYIEPGNKIYTISKSSNIVAEAHVDETFDSRICIYELVKFLGVISLFDSPEFEFDDRSVTIHGNNNGKVKYHFCEPKVIEKYVGQHGKLPKEGKKHFSFSLTQRQIDELIRSANILQINTIKISASDNGGIEVSAADAENTTPNVYSIHLEDGVVHSDEAQDAYIQLSLLNLINGNYDIDVYAVNVTKWTHKDIDLKYYIAKDVEKD